MFQVTYSYSKGVLRNLHCFLALLIATSFPGPFPWLEEKSPANEVAERAGLIIIPLFSLRVRHGILALPENPRSMTKKVHLELERRLKIIVILIIL